MKFKFGGWSETACNITTYLLQVASKFGKKGNQAEHLPCSVSDVLGKVLAM